MAFLFRLYIVGWHISQKVNYIKCNRPLVVECCVNNKILCNHVD